MSVRDAMRFARPFYTTWNQDLVDQVLDHFKLPLKKRLFRLSNGQRAQVSLALAVAPEPQMMILDDPTIELDTVVRRDFLESMIQIIQQEGRTILFSSHILSDVDGVADRIGIIVDGVLRVDCSSEHFRNSVRRVVVELSEPVTPEPAFAGLTPGGRWEIDLSWLWLATWASTASLSSRCHRSTTKYWNSVWKMRSWNTHADHAAMFPSSPGSLCMLKSILKKEAIETLPATIELVTILVCILDGHGMWNFPWFRDGWVKPWRMCYDFASVLVIFCAVMGLFQTLGESAQGT